MRTLFGISYRQLAAGGLTLVVCGCASNAQAPQPNLQEDRVTALACSLPTNCVNSLAGSALPPLRYEGTPQQALAVLRATLAELPEARIVKSDDLTLEAVFTTTVGFKDLVDFRIDAKAQRIDFRSRSSFGLFDFGKNRSRMAAFSARFEINAKRSGGS